MPAASVPSLRWKSQSARQVERHLVRTKVFERRMQRVRARKKEKSHAGDNIDRPCIYFFCICHQRARKGMRQARRTSLGVLDVAGSPVTPPSCARLRCMAYTKKINTGA